MNTGQRGHRDVAGYIVASACGEDLQLRLRGLRFSNWRSFASPLQSPLNCDNRHPK